MTEQDNLEVYYYFSIYLFVLLGKRTVQWFTLVRAVPHSALLQI